LERHERTLQKGKFRHEPHVFNSFLDLLQSYHTHTQTLQNVREGVQLIFKEHPDLIQQFTQFVQEKQEISPENLRKEVLPKSFPPNRFKSSLPGPEQFLSQRILPEETGNEKISLEKEKIHWRNRITWKQKNFLKSTKIIRQKDAQKYHLQVDLLELILNWNFFSKLSNL